MFLILLFVSLLQPILIFIQSKININSAKSETTYRQLSTKGDSICLNLKVYPMKKILLVSD